MDCGDHQGKFRSRVVGSAAGHLLRKCLKCLLACLMHIFTIDTYLFQTQYYFLLLSQELLRAEQLHYL